MLSHELLSKKIYYTSIYIFYILFISRQVQKSKNDKKQQVHQKIHTKQFFMLFKLFSTCNSFEFKVTEETQCQCDSCENMKEFVMMSPHVTPHPIIS